jgi:hypothetical protein
MFTLDRNKLEVRFPDVHPRAKLEIEFQRTLRVPDDNRDYPLPAGLGRFPVRHVDDYPETTPGKWKEHGGVLIPMYQSEALWINFHADYPMAVKVAAGKINAVTGKPFTNELSDDPQDYLVVPQQPWLDGFCIRKGMVRQFVAMPLGEGFTAEEQLTGEATHGGIQLICYPMRREKYEEILARREPAINMRLAPTACYSVGAGMTMGLAPGGMIRQQIHKDRYGLRAWDLDTMSRCFVHLANSEVWQEITGEAPPDSPITKQRYLDARIPWFDFYFADAYALQGSERLAGMDSVAAKTIKKGDPAEELSAPVVVGKTIDLSSRKRVRDGSY